MCVKILSAWNLRTRSSEPSAFCHSGSGQGHGALEASRQEAASGLHHVPGTPWTLLLWEEIGPHMHMNVAKAGAMLHGSHRVGIRGWDVG